MEQLRQDSRRDPSDVGKRVGIFREVVWTARGFLAPCFRPDFYHQAAARPPIYAVMFFLAFSSLVAALATLGIARGVAGAETKIEQEFNTGRVPAITIHGGIAEVSGPPRQVLVDQEGTLIVIDVSGRTTEIDRSTYRQGLLLTRTELQVLNNQGRYQQMRLADIQQAFQRDPILINASTVRSSWPVITAAISSAALLFLLIWHGVVRFVYLVLLALATWGAVSLVRKGTGFGPILAVTLYAMVPALYVRYVFGELGVDFFGLQTLILSLILIVLMWATFLQRPSSAIEPKLEAASTAQSSWDWPLLLGLPFLACAALDLVFEWKAWYLTAATALFTVLAVPLAGYIAGRLQASPAIAPTIGPGGEERH